MSDWHPHPDTVNRRGYLLAPGRRYQLTRSWGYLLAATCVPLGTGRAAALRFYTTSLPDDQQRDQTRAVVAMDAIMGQGKLADQDREASFEAGIYVEAYGDDNADGSIAVRSILLSIAWVDRKDYTPSFGRVDCFLKEAWEAAPCRKDTPLWSEYNQGELFDEWDQSANTSGTPLSFGGGWPGDGGESIYDEESKTLIDEEGSPVESEIDIAEADMFGT